MELLKTILLGIVQGATEFLPVSSSGHLSVAQHVLGIDMDGSVLLDLLLHVGTLFAVFFAFRQVIGRLILEFFRMAKDLFTGKFRWKEMSHDRRMVMTILLGEIPLLFFFLPIPGTEGNLKDLFTGFYADTTIFVEGFCFLFTGCLLLFAHYTAKKQLLNGQTGKEDLSVLDAIIVGIFQGIATLPGVSRSGSTLASGLLRGIDKKTAMDYSFVLGIPAILGASLLEIKDAMEEQVAVDLIPVLIAMVVAAVVGLLCIRLLRWILKKDRLNVFAIYCLILGVVTLIVAIIEQTKGINLFTGTPL